MPILVGGMGEMDGANNVEGTAELSMREHILIFYDASATFHTNVKNGH